MQTFKFTLKSGHTFEGTFEDLFNMGYKMEDIAAKEFLYEEPLCGYSEAHFYNQFKHAV